MDICQVRLPKSSSRQSAIQFAKLLQRVAPNASNGFHFEGRLLRPGAFVDERELPERAVLLEGAGSDGSGKRNSRYLYLLWQYDRTKHEWRELARVWGESWEWALELGPIARQALQPVRLIPDLHGLAERIAHLVDAELEPLEPRERAQLAGVLHDRIATQLAEAAA